LKDERPFAARRAEKSSLYVEGGLEKKVSGRGKKRGRKTDWVTMMQRVQSMKADVESHAGAATLSRGA
jgi:hypothetical protein